MRVLVTGTRGFIGNRVWHFLSKLPNVVRMALNRNEIGAAEEFQPEIVIHCAWPGVERGREQDDWQMDGILLTEQLIASCMPTCRRWVACGSQAEVSTPNLPYARRKNQARALSEVAAEIHGVEFVWARLFSVYGPGEAPETFLSYLVLELLAGRDPALTDQNIPWDFLYVDDAAQALIHLALQTKQTGLFHIANGEGILTQDAARIVRDRINPKAVLRFGVRPRRAIEIDGMWPATDRIRETGWSPQVSFSDGIDALITSIRETPCDS